MPTIQRARVRADLDVWYPPAWRTPRPIRDVHRSGRLGPCASQSNSGIAVVAVSPAVPGRLRAWSSFPFRSGHDEPGTTTAAGGVGFAARTWRTSFPSWYTRHARGCTPTRTGSPTFRSGSFGPRLGSVRHRIRRAVRFGHRRHLAAQHAFDRDHVRVVAVSQSR